MGNIAHRLKPPLENWVVDYFPLVSFRLFFCPIPFKLLGLCCNPSDPLVRFSEQSRKNSGRFVRALERAGASEDVQ